MIRVELQRQAYTDTETLGVWRVIQEALNSPEVVLYDCLSVENPDRGNLPRMSCIPEGKYSLRRTTYHRGGYPCFQIFLENGDEIPGRTQVKVHRGNSALDVLGCVVLGSAPITIEGHWGVGPSGGRDGGFTRFMEIMEGTNVCPLSIYFRKG